MRLGSDQGRGLAIRGTGKCRGICADRSCRSGGCRPPQGIFTTKLLGGRRCTKLEEGLPYTGCLAASEIEDSLLLTAFPQYLLQVSHKDASHPLVPDYFRVVGVAEETGGKCFRTATNQVDYQGYWKQRDEGTGATELKEMASKDKEWCLHARYSYWLAFLRWFSSG